MAERKSRVISSEKEIEYFTSLKEEDISTSFIMENFAEFDGKTKYNVYDIITIPKGTYGNTKKNTNAFTTTIGIFIFNKYFIERDLIPILGYVNQTVDKKLFKKLQTKLSYALNEDRITIPVYDKFLMKTQKCMPYISILAPNYTDKMLTCTKVINKKKHELLVKYKDELEKGNELVADKMEKELMDFALEYMKDDPSMDMFISGARGSVGNNFKNMFVMKGVIKDPDPNAKQKYKVATSNYIDGISPDEYALFANSLAAGPYARAKRTQDGGYREKLFLRAYQHLQLDPEGSDCKTSRYITVTLTKDNISMWMYCYIISGEKLIEITSENMDKFVGKTVKMRFSALCESKTGICNKCMGNLFYRIGIRNIGTALTTVASTQKNIAMKAFHDSTQKLVSMDLMEVFGLK